MDKRNEALVDRTVGFSFPGQGIMLSLAVSHVLGNRGSFKRARDKGSGTVREALSAVITDDIIKSGERKVGEAIGGVDCEERPTIQG